MTNQYKKVSDNLKSSDLIFFILDVKNGITKDDLAIKEYLLKNFNDKNIILIGNKCDNEDILN